MSNWNEQLFDNLSRFVGNERKSKAASVAPVVNSNQSQYQNRISIAVSYGGMSGLVTRSKAASLGKITERVEGNKRVGNHSDGSIAWTIKQKERVTEGEELRALMFDQK